MIARIFLILILLIVLPDLFIHKHYLLRRKGYTTLKRVLYWIPAVVMLVSTCLLAAEKNFAPERTEWLFVYLLLLGIIVIPKAIFAICSFVGLVICRILHKRHNWGILLGLVLAFFTVYIVLYGSFIGNRRLTVKQVDLSFQSLPRSFDGYSIALFSDVHVGSFLDDTSFLERVVSTINDLQADAIVFAGDLQNMLPTELDGMQSVLSELKAKDGVFSILGNHDYSTYIKADSTTMALNESLLRSKGRSMGWKLLVNEHQVLRRGADSIVIAGMENAGTNPSTRWGDVEKTLAGTDKDCFAIMLQHDPIVWHDMILAQCQAQLTMSGHTHGGQFKLFGWSPVSWKYPEPAGLYWEGDRALYVTTGISGFVPFRFGVTPEIVVITLHSGK